MTNAEIIETFGYHNPAAIDQYGYRNSSTDDLYPSPRRASAKLVLDCNGEYVGFVQECNEDFGLQKAIYRITFKPVYQEFAATLLYPEEFVEFDRVDRLTL